MEPSQNAIGDLAVFETAANLFRTGRDFVLAVLIEDSGSTPRKAGAKMIVPAKGDTVGTIGGGGVESAVESAARLMLAGGESAKTMDFRMDGSEGTICGGFLRVFLEAFRFNKRLAIIGAGHVAASVCPVMLRLGFRVIVCDDRPGRLARPEFADAERVETPYDRIAEVLAFGDDLHILVMTPGHEHDFTVVRQVLSQKWRWLGVLGSKKKTRVFLGRLREAGAPEDIIARVRMPVGVEIGSETPDEIAVSIAAELIALHSKKLKAAE